MCGGSAEERESRTIRRGEEVTQSQEKMARILVVEDEAHLAAGLKLNFELEAFSVDVASTVRDARRFLVGEEPYNLIILDVMLPDMNGFVFCERLRAAGDFTPVIMLTALGSPDERVKGLEAGADDYLPKPFDLDELMARVRAQLRRSNWSAPVAPSTDELRFGEVDVNFTLLRATCKGEDVPLTRLEFDLLRYFSDHPNRVLDRTELMEHVWGVRQLVRTRTVDNFVLRLRKAFEPDPTHPTYFVSVRGSGYRFCPEGAGGAHESA
jgi:DNA-binding response OmpR family regulator